MIDSDRAAMARTYLAAGWCVFPLYWVVAGRCVCSAGAACHSPGKHPLVGGGVNSASHDRAVVEGWWRTWPNANVGLPADANGLAVLDVDPRHGGMGSLVRLDNALSARGEPLPATLATVTGSGGCHLIYAAPEGGVKGTSRAFGPDQPGLDTRGRGGYIVAPPSGHASGGTYAWVDFFAPMAPWPALLSALMEPARPAPPAGAGPVEDGDAYGRAALDGEVTRMAAAVEGSRNVTLNTAAFRLGQLVTIGLLEAAAVTEALTTAAAETGLTAAEARATVRSGLRGGARRPRAETP